MKIGTSVSVIVVAFRSEDVLVDCIRSVLDSARIPVEVIVVDNRSPDASSERVVREWHGDPRVNVVCMLKNVGFAAGVNVGASIAAGEYLLILNPDARVLPGSLEQLVEYLDAHRDVGIVGPVLVDERGHVEYSCGPHWNIGDIIERHALPARTSRWFRTRWCRRMASRGQPICVGWVLGACFLVSRKLWEALGGLDARFFLSADDTADLCRRARKLGAKTVCLPKARVFHGTVKSYRGMSEFTMRQIYGGHLVYAEKHYGGVWQYLLRVLFIAISAGKLLTTALMGIVNHRFRHSARVHLATALALCSRAKLVGSGRDAVGPVTASNAGLEQVCVQIGGQRGGLGDTE